MAPKVSFDERIDQLIKFEAVNGHLFVPRSEPGIGKWCDNTRTFKSKLKAEQMAKLDEIGFPWKVPKGPEKAVMIEWGKKFKLLVTFHKMKGHCNVPATLGGKPYPLAGWCDEQRQQLGEEKLERDKFEKLSRLGFDFFGDSSVDSTGGEGEEPVSLDFCVYSGLGFFSFLTCSNFNTVL